MLSQMSGAFVEVKSRSCFALHNEITGKNFVISAESSPILQEWIALIQPMLMVRHKKFLHFDFDILSLINKKMKS
jgi:hypothetical protein